MNETPKLSLYYSQGKNNTGTDHFRTTTISHGFRGRFVPSDVNLHLIAQKYVSLVHKQGVLMK